MNDNNICSSSFHIKQVQPPVGIPAFQLSKDFSISTSITSNNGVAQIAPGKAAATQSTL